MGLLRELWDQIWERRTESVPGRRQIIVPRWIAEDTKKELEKRLEISGCDFKTKAQIIETQDLVTYRQEGES